MSLQFSIDDPHYYSYQYDVSNDGQTMSVHAFGDLDCDGVYSTFSMTGVAGTDGPPGFVPVTRVNELE